jgi:hypothetical protein
MRLILLFVLLCFRIVGYAQLSANAISQNISCNGLCDGSATVTPIGGTAPYQYSWTNGSNTFTTSNLCQGMYTVTVTDANMLTADATVMIIEPQMLMVNVMNVKDESCMGMCDGGIVAVESGGTPPYYYSWNSGSPTAINQLIGVCPGYYNLNLPTAVDV